MEFLKEHLGEDLYKQVKETLKDKDIKLVNLKDGKYVDKNKFEDLEQKKNALSNQLLAQKEEYEKQITDITGTINQFKKKAGENDELQKTISKLQTDLENSNKLIKDKETEFNNKLSEFEKREQILTIKDSIRTFKAKDPDDIIHRIDISKITIKDGKILDGLKDQIEPLRENKKYLFDDAPDDNGGNHFDKDKEQPPKEVNNLFDALREKYSNN